MQVGEYAAQLTPTAQIANLTARQTNVLQAVQVVQLVPNLVETDKLHHYLVLPKGLHVRILMVLTRVLPSTQLVAILCIQSISTLLLVF